MTDFRFALWVEHDGVRKLYGPIDTLGEAKVVAHFMHSYDSSLIMHIHELHNPVVDPKGVIPSHIHLDQTTVDEQIKNAEDYVDPATVG